MAHFFLVIAAGLSFDIFSGQPFYQNHAYGFRVKLPPGVTYTATVPPNPDHGLAITLPDKGSLWVDASYTDSSTTDDEAKMQSAGCRVEEKRSAELGGRPAISLRLSCPAIADGKAYRELLLLTVCQVGDRSPVDYQIGMRTHAGALPQSQELFGKVVVGFSFETKE